MEQIGRGLGEVLDKRQVDSLVQIDLSWHEADRMPLQIDTEHEGWLLIGRVGYMYTLEQAAC